MPVLDGDFEAFVTNLGKYNEGMLVGEWVKLPTTEEEMQKVFERIGIGKQDLVGILVPDIVDILGIMAVDRADEHAARNTQRFVLHRCQKLFGGEHLAALDPVDVGDDTFDFVDIMVADPLFQID